MNTQPIPNARPYKLAFLILTVLGGVMLAAATVLDYTCPGQAFSGFPLGAIVCLFLASLNYSKYLSVQRGARSQSTADALVPQA